MTIDGVKDVMVYERDGKICAAIHPSDINDAQVINFIKKSLNEMNADLPSYKIIPRNGANLGAFDAVKGVADIEEDEDDDLEEPNFD